MYLRSNVVGSYSIEHDGIGLLRVDEKRSVGVAVYAGRIRL